MRGEAGLSDGAQLPVRTVGPTDVAQYPGLDIGVTSVVAPPPNDCAFVTKSFC
jgi:hypothetical protein